MRVAMCLVQTVLDYIYAMAASFEVEGIRAIIIIFLVIYPAVNFFAWSGILGYLELRYHNHTYRSLKDLFKYNCKKNIKKAIVFCLF